MSSNQAVFDEALRLPLYDPDSVRQLCNLLGGGTVADLVVEYETSGVDILARFDQAIAVGDAVSAQREIHGLKSASATLGLTRLSHLCLAIESDCGTGNLDLARSARTEIGENYAESCRLLKNIKVA